MLKEQLRHKKQKSEKTLTDWQSVLDCLSDGPKSMPELAALSGLTVGRIHKLLFIMTFDCTELWEDKIGNLNYIGIGDYNNEIDF